MGSYPLTLTLDWPGPHQTSVRGELTLPVSMGRLWEVLTDYDHLADFIPNLQHSEVLRRDKHSLLLRQEGKIWLPFYRRKVEAVFKVQEVPPKAILFEAVEGDFLLYKGSWEMEKQEEGTKVTYQVTAEPNFWMPRWVINELERQTLKATFRAIIRRCLL